MQHLQDLQACDELFFMNAGSIQVRLRSLSVLLAEDSLFHQKLALKLLKDQGHRVLVVTNGNEVLKAMEDLYFDVILMDIEMPELDGLTTTRVIREREESPLRWMPIIAVTSNDNRDECLQAGIGRVSSQAAEFQTTGAKRCDASPNGRSRESRVLRRLDAVFWVRIWFQMISRHRDRGSNGT